MKKLFLGLLLILTLANTINVVTTKSVKSEDKTSKEVISNYKNLEDLDTSRLNTLSDYEREYLGRMFKTYKNLEDLDTNRLNTLNDFEREYLSRMFKTKSALAQ